MRRLLVSLLKVSALAGVMLAPRDARADVQACVNASEKGQRARAAGKLREAQKQLQICSDNTCPSIVRRDCSQWQGEIAGLLPTVVFGAKDRSGRDLFDVTVTMDGEVVVKALDGKSVAVDPGPHTFLFESAGLPGITERVLVKEGEKARAVNVVLGGDPGAKPASASTPASSNASASTGANEARPDTSADPHSTDRQHTIPPWIVVGAGGAAMLTGIIIIAAAPALPDGCDSGTQTCAPIPGESTSDYRARQEDAGTHDSQPVLGGIILGAGAAVAVGGLLWHFLEPTGPRPSALRLTPWTTARSGGLGLGGTF